MKTGQASETVYVPGKVKGTIPGSTFAQRHYRNNVGENANEKARKGLLGL